MANRITEEKLPNEGHSITGTHHVSLFRSNALTPFSPRTVKKGQLSITYQVLQAHSILTKVKGQTVGQ